MIGTTLLTVHTLLVWVYAVAAQVRDQPGSLFASAPDSPPPAPPFALAVLFSALAASSTVLARAVERAQSPTTRTMLLGLRFAQALIVVRSLLIRGLAEQLLSSPADFLSLHPAVAVLLGVPSVDPAPSPSTVLWQAAVVINGVGVVAYAFAAVAAAVRGTGRRLSLLLVGALCVLAITHQRDVKERLALLLFDRPSMYQNDCARWQSTSAGPAVDAKFLDKFAFASFLTKEDSGARIAFDLFLPPPESKDETVESKRKFPVILVATRYNRCLKRRKFAPQFDFLGISSVYCFPARVLNLIQEAVPRGFAVVSLDVRGTGASSGSRSVDLSDQELDDIVRVIEHVKGFPFYKNKLFMAGISYDGLTSALTASKTHLDGISIMFSPVDLYADLFTPGGLYNRAFAHEYQLATHALEQNLPYPRSLDVPLVAHLLSRLLFDGAAPVPGYGRSFARAVEAHASNWNMTAAYEAKRVHFKDDTLTYDPVTKLPLRPIDLGISARVVSHLREKGTKTLLLGGYYDSTSVRSTMRLHEHLTPANSRVVLGPWTHGARRACSPSLSEHTTRACFDAWREVVDFFSCLDAIDTSPGAPTSSRACVGGPKIPPVRYFTMDADKWQSSATFPPRPMPRVKAPDGKLSSPPSLTSVQLEHSTLYLDQGNRLTPIRPLTSSTTPYTVDYTATSGRVTRWHLVQQFMGKPVVYHDRKLADKKLLTFTSEPLKQGVTMTGSPLLRLTLEIGNATDLPLFVYLEDVLPTGDVRYVTEGVLLASNQPQSPSTTQPDPHPWYIDPFFRPLTRALNSPLRPHVRHRVDLALEPVSYRFRAHHRVRLALAGADHANFDLDRLVSPRTALPTEWLVHHDPSDTIMSALKLPLVKKSSK